MCYRLPCRQPYLRPSPLGDSAVASLQHDVLHLCSMIFFIMLQGRSYDLLLSFLVFLVSIDTTPWNHHPNAHPKTRPSFANSSFRKRIGTCSPLHRGVANIVGFAPPISSRSSGRRDGVSVTAGAGLRGIGSPEGPFVGITRYL